jgi:hypothetical protein
LDTFKRKDREKKQVKKKPKEKKRKSLPPVKNKLPRPTKGQLPDPTYSRMKFASCTDRADSDGWGTGKKKALVWKTEGNFIRSIFLLLILHCFHTL